MRSLTLASMHPESKARRYTCQSCFSFDVLSVTARLQPTSPRPLRRSARSDAGQHRRRHRGRCGRRLADDHRIRAHVHPSLPALRCSSKFAALAGSARRRKGVHVRRSLRKLRPGIAPSSESENSGAQASTVSGRTLSGALPHTEWGRGPGRLSPWPQCGSQ